MCVHVSLVRSEAWTIITNLSGSLITKLRHYLVLCIFLDRDKTKGNKIHNACWHLKFSFTIKFDFLSFFLGDTIMMIRYFSNSQFHSWKFCSVFLWHSHSMQFPILICILFDFLSFAVLPLWKYWCLLLYIFVNIISDIIGSGTTHSRLMILGPWRVWFHLRLYYVCNFRWNTNGNLSVSSAYQTIQKRLWPSISQCRPPLLL